MIRSLTYFSTGYTEAPAFIAKGGGGFGEIRFHATCLLIEHSQEGYLLFDTGYTPRFHEITRRWPYRIHRWSTPVVAKSEWTIAQQLTEKGIAPSDIRKIIVSHFHSDHVGGLKDFPEAEIWCSRASREYFSDKKGFGAVKHGFLPDLLPENLATRV
ncbi:MAG: MBL fold metallo-hydrolase, partial [Bacteroidota bacterium]